MVAKRVRNNRGRLASISLKSELAQILARGAKHMLQSLPFSMENGIPSLFRSSCFQAVPHWRRLLCVVILCSLLSEDFIAKADKSAEMGTKSNASAARSRGPIKEAVWNSIVTSGGIVKSSTTSRGFEKSHVEFVTLVSEKGDGESVTSKRRNEGAGGSKTEAETDSDKPTATSVFSKGSFKMAAAADPISSTVLKKMGGRSAEGRRRLQDAGDLSDKVVGRVAQLEVELDHSLPQKSDALSAATGSNSGTRPEGEEAAADPARSSTDDASPGGTDPRGSRTGKGVTLPGSGREPRDADVGNGRNARVLTPDEGVLAETINLEKLRHVALNPLDRFFIKANRIRFACRRFPPPRCPELVECTGHVTGVSPDTPDPIPMSVAAHPGAMLMCDPGFQDFPEVHTPEPPLNCRSWWERDEARVREQWLQSGRVHRHGFEEERTSVLMKEPQLGCAHFTDFVPESPTAYSVFRLSHVYVSPEAVVFNSSSVFLRGGCQDGLHRTETNEYMAGQRAVKRVGVVVNWAYRQGSNFYHSLIESFPTFLALAPILAKHRNLPLLGLNYQFEVYDTLLAPLVGVPLDSLTRYEMTRKDLFHAEAVYQTLYQYCGHPSPGIWTELRRRHLLHPGGVPLFNPDWSIRETEPLSAAEAAAVPDDWVVVVAQRPGKKRSIVGIQEIEAAILELFGPTRVIVFRGNLPILEARSVFRRARLYVAGHGAAQSNLVFMPEGSHMLEIRPDHFPNPCYHSLAHACSLHYHLVFGHGNSSSTVTVNVQKVMSLVKEIASTF